LDNVSHPDYWDSIYARGESGWDLGTPTPVFQRLIRSGEFSPGQMLVLGAGRGHDAREFARHGFDVTAVDFSAEAVTAMRALMDDTSQHHVLQRDLFTLSQDLQEFDYILEYTCFCAIDPARRAEYADVVSALLKPGGTYIALAIPLDGKYEGGPPFAVDADELVSLLTARGLELLYREFPPDSVKPRRGREELLVLRKS
jgi:hypothetical protein